jgi:nicotinamide-nucleotide amidase
VSGPRIELLATGDELLNGSVVDTNSPWLMAKLGELGLTVWRKTIVGDQRAALVAAMREAAAHSQVVVVSGGLGPTTDDLTAECAAEAAGVSLRFDEPTWTSIEKRMAARGIRVSPNNRRQAMVPADCVVIPNRFGTAPMLELAIAGARCFFLPGVPREYFGLAEEELLPRLAALGAGAPPRRLKLLKTFGLPESQLDQKLADLPERFPGLSLGYRTTLPENHAKLTVVGTDGDAILARAGAEARARLGLDCFGEDADTFGRAVVQALGAQRATVALAETPLTGGRASALLTEAEGAEPVFRGALVESFADAGPAAEAARTRSNATFGLACAGSNAEVSVAIASKEGVQTARHRYGGERARVRELAAYATLDQVRRRLLDG